MRVIIEVGFWSLDVRCDVIVMCVDAEVCGVRVVIAYHVVVTDSVYLVGVAPKFT